MIYYYDFNLEQKLENWKETSRNGDTVCVECEFESSGGKSILLWDEYREGAGWEPRILKVNGIDAEKQDCFYVRPRGARRGMTIQMCAGKNKVTAEFIPRGCKLDKFKMSLIPDWSEQVPAKCARKWTAPEPEEYPETPPLPYGMHVPGLGRELSPGRFGFSKGDGLLDCAMPWFGIVNKMFLCGHPEYRKPFAWTYSLRQDDGWMNTAEEIDVNHLSVRWRRGDTTHTYSLASSGIITERNAGDVAISKLEYAGNYQYVLTSTEVAALDSFSGKMSENWMLFFGSSEFPDIPVLVVLDKKPRTIKFSRLPGGRLTQIVFCGCRRMVTATPFGFEALQPQSPDDGNFLADAARRSRFWSRAFLAFPVSSKEFFLNDHKTKKVNIVQKFEHKIFEDGWGTEALRLAPLPPVLTLCGQEIPEDSVDFRFPTKYGNLRGFAGTTSSYDIAMTRPKRKFPLRDAKSRISDLLSEGLDEYFEFESRFPDTVQSYAYPGAILESYAYCASISNFMPGTKRKILSEKLAERLSKACDPDREYTLLLTDHVLLSKTNPAKEEVHQYYTSPDIGKLRMFNVYERIEPFTGRKYNICYFNVSMMLDGQIKTGSREEVLAYPEVFVENDWGVGITFYMMYTAALITGDYSSIRKHWDTIKKTFSFFDIFQDWACMGAGYAEKARTWIEGANFGAFTSFVNMAEAIGDREAFEQATYLSAKMLALAEARFFSGPYFAGQYGVDVWHGNMALQEEYSPCHNFQHVPSNLGPGRVLKCGVSLLTTDAIYPELFESFRETAAIPHRNIMERYRNALLSGMDSGNNVEFSYLLVNDALDPLISSEKVENAIEIAEKTGRMLNCWHDIHRFENYMPKNYLKCQLLAWLEMRGHLLWLEDWTGMRVDDAEWRDGQAFVKVTATGDVQKLFCGTKTTPTEFSFSGESSGMRVLDDNRVCFELRGSGTLNVRFCGKARS